MNLLASILLAAAAVTSPPPEPRPPGLPPAAQDAAPQSPQPTGRKTHRWKVNPVHFFECLSEKQANISAWVSSGGIARPGPFEKETSACRHLRKR